MLALGQRRPVALGRDGLERRLVESARCLGYQIYAKGDLVRKVGHTFGDARGVLKECGMLGALGVTSR